MPFIFSTPHRYAVFVCYQHCASRRPVLGWILAMQPLFHPPIPISTRTLAAPFPNLSFRRCFCTGSIPAGSPSTVLSGNGWKTHDNCRIWFLSWRRAALWLGSRVPITEYLLYKKEKRCISCLLQQERCPRDCTTIAWVRLQGVEASVLWVVLLFQ